MINLQNPYAYGASLNNLLHKARQEAGVERVVITLLNDILSDLVKWPDLSAEDTPNFGAPKRPWDPTVRGYYGLKKSGCPDGMILDNLVTYQQAIDTGAVLQPRALIETKWLTEELKSTIQLTSYLNDLRTVSTLNFVILTNGLCWKIWTKDDSGKVSPVLDTKLDKDLVGYVRSDKNSGAPIDATGKPLKSIQIDRAKFSDLILRLKDFLSTL